MTKPATIKLTMVLFSTLALAGCGTDPYAGATSPPASGGTTAGTGGATSAAGGALMESGGAMMGTGGVVTATGGATTVPDASTAAPDVGVDSADAPSSGPTINYKISVSPNRLLDLVFMIDNSPSMAPKVAKMNAQFPKLIAALQDPNNNNSLPDLRVAIIDSDLGTGGAYSSGSCGPNVSNGMSSYGDQGKFRMINAAGCGVTSTDALWLEYTKGTPVNFAGDINTVFACLASGLGTLGCGEEHQLQAFEFALVAGGLGNDLQHMMLRGNANLGLVFLTDEDDCSAATNDGMFGDKSELSGESASLRCYTRSHACNGQNLANPPPGYPTTSAFTAPLSSCTARTDDCPNATDGNGQTDTSVPTNCSPLKSIKNLATEIKGLKADPDNQIFVAGIFGWPLTDADMATASYKIDLIPNPNPADTAHPSLYDSWPVCYDPNHKPADASKFDATAAGWGATAGLREAAFIDEFGANGQKFSICQTDFTTSMKTIGDNLANKLQNLCINDKLFLTTPGLQPDCDVHYRTPAPDPNNPSNIIYTEDPTSIPLCPAGATSNNITADCWTLITDTTKCPSAFNGQMVNVLRTKGDLLTNPLPAGTLLGMQCRICSTSPSADQPTGCNY
jgi:hypothetical protein